MFTWLLELKNKGVRQLSFFYYFVLIISNFLLQTTILQHFRIAGVVPNTTLIIIVIIALLKGKKVGGIMGISMGLLQDLMFNEVIGIYALIYFIIGYTIGLIDNKVYKENSLIALIFTFGATICFYILFYFLMFFLSVDISFNKVFKEIVFLEMIYNLILAFPIYKLITHIFRKPEFSFRK
ncbi:rod shape-determining protein MreD [Sporosalibacterium faouarense]|uniref:rod shape-determining protein MreD n=1 Tax=Sporosalibacterium faouarense TaxID=516123 RepID=UPI00141C4563|nr:rod shape-determining protein MreD [Sporosalibacterium faouarense]MTI48512.1 rod shape-determining protein MreD [Bacillota bacterium]